MVKPKTPRAKSLPRSKDAEVLDRAHDALLDAAKAYEDVYENGSVDRGRPGYLQAELLEAGVVWARAQRKALGLK